MLAKGIKEVTFGSTVTRFPVNIDYKNANPGPGQYNAKFNASEAIIISNANQSLRPLTQPASYMFKSTSKRFDSIKETQIPIMEGSRTTSKFNVSAWQAYQPQSNGKFGFSTSVARFAERSNEATPGPGFYEEQVLKKSITMKSSTSGKQYIKKMNSIGPGYYNPTKDYKRSFNVSMDVKLDNV